MQDCAALACCDQPAGQAASYICHQMMETPLIEMAFRLLATMPRACCRFDG